MKSQQLHKVEVSILYSLRQAPSARFSELMRPTGLASDTFKFHLRSLVKAGWVEKTPAGVYRLTTSGKEYANNLDEVRRGPQKQPKLSVRLVIPEPNAKGVPRYLFQKRLRNPYFDFWACIGGAVQWGEDFEATAARELTKQTGLTATFKVRAFYRKADYRAGTHDLLEDKLFVVVEATKLRGQLLNDWHGGFNQWMTIEEFKQQPKRFESAYEIIEMVRDKKTYLSRQPHYQPDDY